MYTYAAFHKSQKHVLQAPTLYDAKLAALKHFKLRAGTPAARMMPVVLVEKDGQPVPIIQAL